MSDIVERLRELHADMRISIGSVASVAADEIERLRDALRGLVDFIEIDNIKIDPLALSIAREALAFSQAQRNDAT